MRLFDIVFGGLFHAAVLFLVAAGLQLVFGVQKVVNLACGSFYALGAYVGVTSITISIGLGMPAALFPFVLIVAGLLIALVGIGVELLLQQAYERDDSFQMLLTFAVLLMFQDIIRFFWGATPLSLTGVYMLYGTISIGSISLPTYNLFVILISASIAGVLGYFLQGTNYGRILRATAENRGMAQALGVDVRRLYQFAFVLGTALGTIGGALVVPASAASLDMGLELVVEAFAVVVIGGLGSMPGAAAGALCVGVVRSIAVSTYPEVELFAIYLIVVIVLVVQPRGLFGKAMA
ncbi:branched-chain amino acid ABC transporter permease [Bradyrhizobium ottawaense]|uniref:branched-chain amino acid ABC transporter permease n=1 Tax=Bradyrhizobium ottawaense TaxID=931866 RepID=UPI0004829CE3|nr:branched-chain amino acid ABC transporter permease [Bradyrhizobium ottawaense]